MFGWVLELLADAGLVKAKQIGIDATTLKANAALRSIMRRDNGEGYEEFLKGLARQSGIRPPTREDPHAAAFVVGRNAPRSLVFDPDHGQACVVSNTAQS